MNGVHSIESRLTPEDQVQRPSWRPEGRKSYLVRPVNFLWVTPRARDHRWGREAEAAPWLLASRTSGQPEPPQECPFSAPAKRKGRHAL